MNLDTHELQQVSACDGAASAPRVDIYVGIHKALRALMADTLLALGRMDSDDALEVAQVGQRVLTLLDICTAHFHHENQFVHTAMEARAPGSSAAIAHEHGEHEQAISELAGAVNGMLRCTAEAREATVLALYRKLALFIAHNFEHMHVEETAHNAVLWARYTDAELRQIEGAIVASIPPDDMMALLRWMVPFMNPAERRAMLAGMQAEAPAPVFAAVLDTVRPHLSCAEWAKLSRSLGLAPAPGLVVA